MNHYPWTQKTNPGFGGQTTFTIDQNVECYIIKYEGILYVVFKIGGTIFYFGEPYVSPQMKTLMFGSSLKIPSVVIFYNAESKRWERLQNATYRRPEDDPNLTLRLTQLYNIRTVIDLSSLEKELADLQRTKPNGRKGKNKRRSKAKNLRLQLAAKKR